jgi:RNA polymerase sigma-70 factor (ECF subfamily)
MELGRLDAERLRSDLVHFLTFRTADPALVEDLAQEALVHVLRGLPGFEQKADLRTWARRIALNVWRDHLRRRAARAAERVTSSSDFSVLSILDSIGPTAPAPLPEDAYDQQTTHECLLAAARRLPLAERELILLHDFGVVPLERAAAMAGCSLGAAKVRLHRARRRLAQICRAECTSEAAGHDAILCSPRASSNPPASPAKRRSSVQKKRR